MLRQFLPLSVVLAVTALLLYLIAQRPPPPTPAPTNTPTPTSQNILQWHGRGGAETSPPFQVTAGGRYSVSWIDNTCPVGVAVGDAAGRAWQLVPDQRTRDPHGAWGGELPADLPPGLYLLATSARCPFTLYVFRSQR